MLSHMYIKSSHCLDKDAAADKKCLWVKAKGYNCLANDLHVLDNVYS